MIPESPKNISSYIKRVRQSNGKPLKSINIEASFSGSALALSCFANLDINVTEKIAKLKLPRQ